MAAVFAVMAMTPAFAGDPNTPTGAPGAAASAMFTLESIYQRLATGAAGAKRVGPFDEPTSGPGAMGHTLDEVMGLAPAVDAAGATAGDVMTGKKFWGLVVPGGWGLQTGTLACSATATGTAVSTDVLTGKTFSNSSANGITGTMANNGAFTLLCGATNQTVTAGYSGGGTLAGDADLVAGNIKSGVDIFGVTGTYSCGAAATGDALAADVLTGKTFSNGTSSGIAGAMANNSPGTATIPGTLPYTIPAGYHDGTGTVAADANLVAANIVSGKTIFGVAGSASAATNPAAVPKTGDSTDGATGVNFPNPRFTVNAGTVKDNLTGLIWLKNAKCTDTISGITPAAGLLTWQNAKDWIAGLKGDNTLCGLNDGSTAGQWRLPTLRELQSLIHYGYFSPALSDTVGTAKWTTNGDPFDNVQSDYYWSATTYAVDPAPAWFVSLYVGFVGSDVKTLTFYVLPVR